MKAILILMPLLLACCGHQPSQWSKVVETPTDAEFDHFASLAATAPSNRVVLNEEDSKLILAKLAGPVRQDFMDSSLKDPIWLWGRQDSIEFYRMRKHGAGHAMFGWSRDPGMFISGGAASAPW